MILVYVGSDEVLVIDGEIVVSVGTVTILLAEIDAEVTVLSRLHGKRAVIASEVESAGAVWLAVSDGFSEGVKRIPFLNGFEADDISVDLASGSEPVVVRAPALVGSQTSAYEVVREGRLCGQPFEFLRQVNVCLMGVLLFGTGIKHLLYGVPGCEKESVSPFPWRDDAYLSALSVDEDAAFLALDDHVQ